MHLKYYISLDTELFVHVTLYDYRTIIYYVKEKYI